MPVSYFIFFTVVLHANVEIDVMAFINRCMIFLVLPLGLSWSTWALHAACRQNCANRIESFSRRSTILALMVFGIGIVGPARDLLWSDPQRFCSYLLIVTALGAGMAYLTAIVMFRQGISDSLTASIVSGFRNVGLGLCVALGHGR